MANNQPWGLISGAVAVIGVVLMVVGALIHFKELMYLGVIALIAGAAAYRFMGV